MDFRVYILCLSDLVTIDGYDQVLRQGGLAGIPTRRTRRPPLNRQQRWENYVKHLKWHTTPWPERYSPNFGYEPYWKDGDWVFEDFFKNGSTSSTTPIPKVCGRDCQVMYRSVGHVCGMYPEYIGTAKSSVGFMGCWTYWGYTCFGRWTDDHPYVTFNTYCEFLDVKCRNYDYPYKNNVIFVHLGKCLPVRQQNYREKAVFQYIDSRNKNDYDDNPPWIRATMYLSLLYSRYSTMELSTRFPVWDNGTTTTEAVTNATGLEDESSTLPPGVSTQFAFIPGQNVAG